LKTSFLSSVSESWLRQCEALQRALGHCFNDTALLRLALTHRSAHSNHNERIEFLGDGLLNFVIAEALFERFPAVDEGTLSRMRASLVKGETLAEIARELDLGDCVILGQGERQSGGRHRDSILADAVEALLGAIYLDAGIAVASASIRHLWQQRLRTITPDLAKDAKTRLQEWLQGRGLPLPVYELISGDPDGVTPFQVRCRIQGGAGAYQASGGSRRRAEQAAALIALTDLETHD
jgi:ribonuclease III